ncbi:uncharacterized protein PHACADRAFT_258151 [Phanerochaete carnosa HHB-10118-sp]|uniref:Uncharacterized protein n=1 Tax=Phanerochaete carnosa (strain HHB-10118-sp) TaxID=650164 RepID=K5UWE8_PHACS|nr:uncharacterized protein PHACADRAFT_258151 [Phanerochaete carnosa HHB-10118-sp]EKM54351.1 hypothetical protein PHACADRAFT_258151 [Phanerochaete carnosa HHB-10118-sp]
MSLLRAATARQKQALLSTLPRRNASTHHEEHHHEEHHHEDTTVYPQETFANKVWLGWALAGLTASAFYKFAPSPEDDSYVKRLIDHYRIPKEAWEKINIKHLTLEAQGAQEMLIVADARRPPVHRFRFPQRFEQHSAHLHPVGGSPDLADLAVKDR